ncbi:STAS domain-containing protein [Kineococcus terrestris]|uniref:STAS domain-containing protein n=1 Tax=Kineococcus terrestris TaxID=2044856 RepID=UPI0034DADCC3
MTTHPGPRACTPTTCHLGVDVHADGTTTTVRLDGELELTTAEVLLGVVDGVLRRPASGPDAPARVVVDARDLSFCDVTGLNALLEAQRRAARSGGHLHLRTVRPFLRHVIAATGCDCLLDGGPARGPGTPRGTAG